MPNYYHTSDGRKLTYQTVRSYYSKEISGWSADYLCEAYGFPKVAHDWDHTISRERCRHLRKSELIWSRGNVVRSSREAHYEWETFSNGKFSHHKNAYQRMLFVAMHDAETFKKRFQAITNEDLKQRLKELYETIDDKIVF